MHDTRTRSPTLRRLDAGADGFDRADRFVTEDAAVGHRGNVTFQNVQVSSADRDGVDTDDGIGVVEERWVGHVFPCLASGSVIDERTHLELLPLSTWRTYERNQTCSRAEGPSCVPSTVRSQSADVSGSPSAAVLKGGQHRGREIDRPERAPPLIGEAQLDTHEHTQLKVAELLVVAGRGHDVFGEKSRDLPPHVHLDRSARSVVQS